MTTENVQKSFNTQPPEGGWVPFYKDVHLSAGFQHTAARRRLGRFKNTRVSRKKFQHTAARRRLGLTGNAGYAKQFVSTHSRPKAAGNLPKRCALDGVGFNTQPPEGGWALLSATYAAPLPVSTHSRPKAAGLCFSHNRTTIIVSTHSRPKAAGRCFKNNAYIIGSFNTQPPEGGWARPHLQQIAHALFQHTAARRRLANNCCKQEYRHKFQHTAARRRLGAFSKARARRLSFQHTAARRRLEAVWQVITETIGVSTHSRPKAAGRKRQAGSAWRSGFNTQPPEGGWVCVSIEAKYYREFQHTAARRRLACFSGHNAVPSSCFNTQPPEGGWVVPSQLENRLADVSTHSRPKAAGWLRF